MEDFVTEIISVAALVMVYFGLSFAVGLTAFNLMAFWLS